MNLNLNDDDFSRSVRQYARLGFVSVNFRPFVCYCPFCLVKDPKDPLSCYFTHERSHYEHAKICTPCKIFQNDINKLENDFLTNLADFVV